MTMMWTSTSHPKPWRSRATRSLGKNQVRVAENGWLIRGMDSTMRHFQIEGMAWMRQRELGEEAPRGGINADAMGLGKTITTLACRLLNKPPPDSDTRTTLIVLPSSLISQWQSEIDRHFKPAVLGKTLKFCAGSRIEGSNPEDILRSVDIVLTTYAEVVRGYPKKPPPEKKTPKEQQDWWKNAWKNRGVLHKVGFYRVILDERHMTKGINSQAAQVCAALTADRRWILSGTPLVDRSKELWSYFRFLRMTEIGSRETFISHLNDDDSQFVCGEQIQDTLGRMTLRRTHQDTLFGAPILKLPPITERTLCIELSPLERQIYDIIVGRYAGMINSQLRQKDMVNSYHNALVLLTRLRQITAHIFLVLHVLSDLLTIEAVDQLWEAIELDAVEREQGTSGIPSEEQESTKKMNVRQLDSLRKMLLAGPLEHLPKEASSSPEDDELERTTPLAYKFRDALKKHEAAAKLEELRLRKLCQRCHQIPVTPIVTDCLHIYCSECLVVLATEAAADDQSQAACLECGSHFQRTNFCAGLRELSEASAHDISTVSARNVKYTRPAKRPEHYHKLIFDNGGVIGPSKTAAVMKQMEEWVRIDPQVKIIVFTQFRMIIKVVNQICSDRGWGTCCFHGQLELKARDKCIASFRDNPEKRVFISSLKSGGVGLNLTMATKVISVDLWWNNSVEQQAFCRVYRHGQTKPTEITRFIVNDTVDERMQQMQDDKKVQIDGVLNEQTETLSMQNLLRLLGPVRKDVSTDQEVLVVAEDDERAADEDARPMADG